MKSGQEFLDGLSLTEDRVVKIGKMTSHRCDQVLLGWVDGQILDGKMAAVTPQGGHVELGEIDDDAGAPEWCLSLIHI